jgi:uncharacterized protein (DUF39 family)
VVNTGTFGPMCSSGAYLNVGHSKPKIKLGGGSLYLNDVPAYAGFAAVDVLIGATGLPDNDPRNRTYPGEFNYGGGHVIEDLVAGKGINEAVLFDIRNAYQNYNVAVNISDRTIYTYMGVLKPKLGNANYCSAGQLSPLLNDPYYRTIGVGTRIFLGGGIGYVAWHGTQHVPDVLRGENGVPRRGAGTLAVIGDLKQMRPDWLRGVSFLGYGCTLMVGIGVPIPILSEETLRFAAVKDEDIFAPIVDYAEAYPQGKPGILGEVSYAQLKSGRIGIKKKDVPTASLSSYSKAVEIAQTLKGWIGSGHFLLTEPVAPLPGVESGITFKPLKQRLR